MGSERKVKGRGVSKYRPDLWEEEDGLQAGNVEEDGAQSWLEEDRESYDEAEGEDGSNLTGKDGGCEKEEKAKVKRDVLSEVVVTDKALEVLSGSSISEEGVKELIPDAVRILPVSGSRFVVVFRTSASCRRCMQKDFPDLTLLPLRKDSTEAVALYKKEFPRSRETTDVVARRLILGNLNLTEKKVSAMKSKEANSRPSVKQDKDAETARNKSKSVPESRVKADKVNTAPGNPELDVRRSGSGRNSGKSPASGTRRKSKNGNTTRNNTPDRAKREGQSSADRSRKTELQWRPVGESAAEQQ